METPGDGARKVWENESLSDVSACILDAAESAWRGLRDRDLSLDVGLSTLENR